MIFRNKTSIVSVALLAFLICSENTVKAEVQEIRVPETGWYFVSLQVAPDNPAPNNVFDISKSEIVYDAIWNFSLEAGWSFYTPIAGACTSGQNRDKNCYLDSDCDPIPGVGKCDLSFQDRIVDLKTIRALTGYWIHVTAVPPGGGFFRVSGTPVAVLELNDSGWHSVGFPVGPTARNLSVSEGLPGLSLLGEQLASLVTGIWYFDRESMRMAPLDVSATCPNPPTPQKCVNAGEGYWMRTLSALKAGESLSVTQTRLNLNPKNPVARLDIKFDGVASSGSGIPVDIYFDGGSSDKLRYYGAQVSRILNKDVKQPGSVEEASPYLAANTPSNVTSNVTSACNSACPVGRSCVTLCMDASSAATSEQTIYVDLNPTTLLDLDRFHLPQEGTEANGTAPFGKLHVMLRGKEAATVDVRPEPFVVKGRYAGLLRYDNGAEGVPIDLVLDQCRENSDGKLRCNERELLTAVINPIIRGSSSNGIDDDGDGFVDNSAAEESQIPLRNSPGFAQNTILHGQIGRSSDSLRLELGGEQPVELEFPSAATRCNGIPSSGCDTSGVSFGRCSGTGERCCNSNECVAGAQAGLGGLVSKARRELVLYGTVLESSIIQGYFSDRYFLSDEASFAERSLWSVTGTFVLSPLEKPVCASILQQPGIVTPSFRSIGTGCRSDDDCAKRCVSIVDGAKREVAGLCGNGESCPAGASCESYKCSFLEFGEGLKAVRRFNDLIVKAKTGTVELIGSGAGVKRHLGAVRDGSLSFANLPCGEYTAIFQATGCPDPAGITTKRVVKKLNPCSQSSYEMRDFDSCVIGPLSSQSVGMAGGRIRIIGNGTLGFFPSGTGTGAGIAAASGKLGGNTVYVSTGEPSGLAIVPGPGFTVKYTEPSIEAGRTRVIPRVTNVSGSFTEGVALRHGLLEAVHP